MPRDKHTKDKNKRPTVTELRHDSRYPLPVLEFAIGQERFHTINWSMGGALLDGICELVGSRVRGVMGMADSREGVPFTATVIRVDLDTGNCAICFEDSRTAHLDFAAERVADPFH